MKHLVFVILLLPICAHAQMNEGGRITALGTSGVAIKDIWAIEKNQAGLSDISAVTLALNYEQRLVSQDISTQAALLVLPYRRNVFALSFQRYGFSLYNQQKASIAYARNLTPDFSAGINFNYHQLKISGYGSASTISIEAGFQYQVNEGLTLGAHISNPSNGQFNADVQGVVPVAVAFGVANKFSDKILLTSEVVKVLDFDFDLKLGVEYQPVGWLALRGGLSANPLRQYGGLGVTYNGIRFDAAVASEFTVGYSPQVGLSYAF